MREQVVGYQRKRLSDHTADRPDRAGAARAAVRHRGDLVRALRDARADDLLGSLHAAEHAHDLTAAAAGDVRPRRHRRALHRPPLPDRRADGLRLRRPPRRRRHQPSAASTCSRPGWRAPQPCWPSALRARLPLVRAVAEVRQPQRAARQGGRAGSLLERLARASGQPLWYSCRPAGGKGKPVRVRRGPAAVRVFVRRAERQPLAPRAGKASRATRELPGSASEPEDLPPAKRIREPLEEGGPRWRLNRLRLVIRHRGCTVALASRRLPPPPHRVHVRVEDRTSTVFQGDRHPVHRHRQGHMGATHTTTTTALGALIAASPATPRSPSPGLSAGSTALERVLPQLRSTGTRRRRRRRAGRSRSARRWRRSGSARRRQRAHAGALLLHELRPGDVRHPADAGHLGAQRVARSSTVHASRSRCAYDDAGNGTPASGARRCVNGVAVACGSHDVRPRRRCTLTATGHGPGAGHDARA